MRYHSNLIKHYISIKDTPDSIAQKLILKTCEVEEIIKRELPDDLLIGKVTSVRKHPQADKLVVCDVDCGPKGSFTICTGGENVVENSFVPVAIPGCYLPVIDLKIEPRTMRGEPSNGMICSKGEIGIMEDEDQHWIWTLQYGQNTPADKITQPADFDDITDEDCGKPMKEKYPWLEAYIFDVDNKTVTNRPDLTGHFGLAWELQAMYAKNPAKNILRNKLPNLMNNLSFTSADQIDALGNHHDLPVHVTCDAVKVYSTILLKDIQTQPSTFYTRTILRDCGLTPKLNWVDLSNSFMMLTGHPVHCFDADKITGAVTVRYAKDGEEFVDLLDTTHKLLPTDIVIADDEKVLALGGVMGGKSSAVTENTKNILVEIAHFDGVVVRKTGTRLALRTDAEMRYEKQINPQYTPHVIQMFLDFLQFAKKDIGNYQLVGLSYYTAPTFSVTPLQIPVNWENISQPLLGDDSLPVRDSKKILEDLGFKVFDDSVIVPWWRGANDIDGFHDITEEVIRIYGYENIESKPVVGAMLLPQNENVVGIVRTAEEILVKDFAMTQVETYPWLPQKYIDFCQIDTANHYTVKNPPAPELRTLRDSMFYGLLDVVTKNAKIYDKIAIFDIGKVWPVKDAKREEKQECGIMIFSDGKDKKRQDDSWFLAKQSIQQICDAILGDQEITLKQSNTHYFSTNKQADIFVEDVCIGRIGQLHPKMIDRAKLEKTSSVTYAQLSIGELAAHKQMKQPGKYETLQDQILQRDFSFVIDKNMNWEKLEQAIKSIKEVAEIKIFDIYSGDKLPEGKKAIAFSCKIIAEETLKTEDINAIMDRIIKACENTGATLR